jgi:lipopolysaccharide export system permease protein
MSSVSVSPSVSPWLSAVRRMLPAPLGWHTRTMLSTYARHTFLATCAIIALAVSIDLTLFLPKVLAVVSEWPAFWGISVAWYVVLRASDFLAELLPLTCFVGVFWAEVVHTLSQERLVVWLSGRAVQQCLVPVLLFGAMVGVTELALNIYLRPLAVMQMAVDHLGSYGERFDPRPLPDPQWLAAGRDLIQAVVEPGSPPVLHEVKVYRLDDSLALASFYQAKLAKPLDDHTWLLLDGARWTSPLVENRPALNLDEGNPVVAEQETPFVQEKLDLTIAPVWINNVRTEPRYLTNDVFSALGKVKFSPDSEFRTWAQARYSLSLFGLALPLLAAVLSMLLLATDVSLPALCIVALSCYVANSAMKLFILLGEHDYLSPVVAGWTVPVFLLVLCAIAVRSGREIISAGARFTRDKRPARV